MIIGEETPQLCGIDTSDGVVMSFNLDGTDSELHFDFVTFDKVKGWQPSDMTGKWMTFSGKYSQRASKISQSICTETAVENPGWQCCVDHTSLSLP